MPGTGSGSKRPPRPSVSSAIRSLSPSPIPRTITSWPRARAAMPAAAAWAGPTEVRPWRRATAAGARRAPPGRGPGWPVLQIRLPRPVPVPLRPSGPIFLPSGFGGQRGPVPLARPAPLVRPVPLVGSGRAEVVDRRGVGAVHGHLDRRGQGCQHLPEAPFEVQGLHPTAGEVVGRQLLDLAQPLGPGG